MKLDEKQCSMLMRAACRYRTPDYTVEAVNKAVSKLSPRAAQILFVKTKDNLTHAEVSSKLNISVNVVGQVYRDSLDFIRRATKTGWFTGNEITKDCDIEVLGLSHKARLALSRNRYETLEAVLNITYDDLLKLRYANKTIITEIATALVDNGITVKGYDKSVSYNSYKHVVKENLNVAVATEMLDVIYNKCQRRFIGYGKDCACDKCPYRSIDKSNCMFTPRPTEWQVTEYSVVL